MVNPLYMLFLVYNTSFDKSILTLKTCLYAIIFLRKRETNMKKKKRRRLKKKIRNRLILAFGLLITLFILVLNKLDRNSFFS